MTGFQNAGIAKYNNVNSDYHGLEEQAILMFDVLKRQYSFEWIQEMISTVDTSVSLHYEQYTIVHMAVKGGLYRLLHDVFLDQFCFDVDFYRP